MLHNFISNQPLETLLAESSTLAVLRFEGSSLDASAQIAGVPSTRAEQLSTAQADNLMDEFEVWQIDGEEIESGTVNDTGHGDLNWRRSEGLQFVSLTAELNNEGDFEAVAKQAYTDLLTFIEKSKHPQLVRFWNYVPHINVGEGDRENYKTFCSGRLAAFRDFELDDRQFPAASAVGHYRDGLTICALTSVKAPQHHANPRQVDAFKYPRQYGASSPSFARATTIKIDHVTTPQQLCFISGTASILGHSSVHHDDLRLQLYTTNDNILYLLEQTKFTADSIQALRVYVRHASDYAECKNVVEELYPGKPAIYIHADICRAELLVEIECFCVMDA